MFWTKSLGFNTKEKLLRRSRSIGVLTRWSIYVITENLWTWSKQQNLNRFSFWKLLEIIAVLSIAMEVFQTLQMIELVLNTASEGSLQKYVA